MPIFMMFSIEKWCVYKMSSSKDSVVRVTALWSRFKTATEMNFALQHAAQPAQQRVSNQTIRQRLHEYGIWS